MPARNMGGSGLSADDALRFMTSPDEFKAVLDGFGRRKKDAESAERKASAAVASAVLAEEANEKMAAALDERESALNRKAMDFGGREAALDARRATIAAEAKTVKLAQADLAEREASLDGRASLAVEAVRSLLRDK